MFTVLFDRHVPPACQNSVAIPVGIIIKNCIECIDVSGENWHLYHQEHGVFIT